MLEMAPDKSMWRINLGLAVAELICVTAFIIEVKRALGGNTLSWAYVFEWPRSRSTRCTCGENYARTCAARRPSDPSSSMSMDPKLDEWNAYLASVHHKEKPVALDDRDG